MAGPSLTRDRTQRVHWFAGRLGEVLDGLVGDDGEASLALGVLSADEITETVTELDRGIARLIGLRGSVVAHADSIEVGLSATPVATSTSAWLRAQTVTSGPTSSRTVKLALACDERCRATGAALRAGRIDADQAHEIVRALDMLPADLDPDLRTEAEAPLLQLAATHAADALRKLGKHLHEVVDPEAAETKLAAQLAKEEADAAEDTFLRMRSTGDGRTTGEFCISDLHGTLLRAILDMHANPTRPGANNEDGSTRLPSVFESRDRAWGRAFGELLESIPADILPSQGGTAIAAVVTMTLEQLLGATGVVTLDTGQQISAGEARRLAARHGVIPAVLGGPSVVLDLGRKQRLFTRSQRLALRIQHRTCTAAGCQIPAAWCQAHHKLGWHPKRPGQNPGRTDLANGTLLCGRHHRLVDNPGYGTTYKPDGTTLITRIRR